MQNRLNRKKPNQRKQLILKRSYLIESARIMPAKAALKTALMLLSKATKRNPANSTKFFFKLTSIKSPNSFAVFGFGGKRIDREAFIRKTESILKGRDLAEVKSKFAELTGYSINDLAELGGSPVLGSKATAKVEVFKKNSINNVVLVGACVPSFKRNSGNLEKNRRFLYENLINNVRSVYGKNTVFTLRIPKEDSRVASFIESRFIVSKTEPMQNVISLTINLNKAFKRKK